jgi:predicted transposase YbfD/YdcC
MNGLTLLDHISIIKDPREKWKVKHTLSDILFFAVVAVIASADGWEEIKYFGKAKLTWLQQYGDYKNGIPVNDTIARFISIINPNQFQSCFIAWMNDCHSATKGCVIAIDGKTVGCTYNPRVTNAVLSMSLALFAPPIKL